MVRLQNAKTTVVLASVAIFGVILLLPVGLASAMPKATVDNLGFKQFQNEAKLTLSSSTANAVLTSDEKCEKWNDIASKAKKIPPGIAKKIKACEEKNSES